MVKKQRDKKKHKKKELLRGSVLRPPNSASSCSFGSENEGRRCCLPRARTQWKLTQTTSSVAGRVPKCVFIFKFMALRCLVVRATGMELRLWYLDALHQMAVTCIPFRLIHNSVGACIPFSQCPPSRSKERCESVVRNSVDSGSLILGLGS